MADVVNNSARIYAPVDRSVSEINKAIESTIDAMGQSEPACTCKEYEKQRALCPVCDSAAFERGREFAQEVNKTRY